MDFTLQKPAATLEGMPVEIMNMIIEAMVPVPAVIDSDSASDCSSDHDKAHDDFILNAYDVSALRLASRTPESTTLDAFTRRFFTVRKHMLSKASITCLSQIASCPKFSSVVYEVAIGPERINSGLMMFMGVVREEYTKNWKREAQGDWQALVDEQRAFDASGQAHSMLKNALKGFANLAHVRIDTYPDNKGDDDADWSKAWGAKSMMRKAGFALLINGDYCGLSARYFLLEEANGVMKLHGHYAKVLEALNAIQDKDWTLELGFNAMNLRYEDKPFDLDSSDWQNNKSRVRALTFSSALDGKLNIIFDELWLLSLLQGCQKLESLTLRHEYSLGYFLRRVRFSKLRFLGVRQSSLPYHAFPHFLETHKHTLASVTCEKTRLTDFSGFRSGPVDADLYNRHPTWVQHLRDHAQNAASVGT
jgi:hypothetical protein